MEKEKTAINFTEAIKIAEKYTGPKCDGKTNDIGYVNQHIQATDGHIGIMLYVGGENGPDKHLDMGKVVNVEFKETAQMDLMALEHRIKKLKKLINPKNYGDFYIEFKEGGSIIFDRFQNDPDFMSIKTLIDIPILKNTRINLKYFMQAYNTLFNDLGFGSVEIGFNGPLSMIIFRTDNVKLILMPIKP